MSRQAYNLAVCYTSYNIASMLCNASTRQNTNVKNDKHSYYTFTFHSCSLRSSYRQIHSKSYAELTSTAHIKANVNDIATTTTTTTTNTASPSCFTHKAVLNTTITQNDVNIKNNHHNYNVETEEFDIQSQDANELLTLRQTTQLPIIRSKRAREIEKWQEYARKLLESDELVYDGYLTEAIQSCKNVILSEKSTEEEIEHAINVIDEESEELKRLIGHWVTKPLTQVERIQCKVELLKTNLAEADNPFRRTRCKSNYEVKVNADGSETLKVFASKERVNEENNMMNNDVGNPSLNSYSSYNDLFASRRNRMFARLLNEQKTNMERKDYTEQSYSQDTDVKVNAKAVEEELRGEDDSDKFVAKTIQVTMADLDYVQFLKSIALRRLGQFNLAEKISYEILRNDCFNVDVIKSLLEMYLGFSHYERICLLFEFLQLQYDKMLNINVNQSLPLVNEDKVTESERVVKEITETMHSTILTESSSQTNVTTSIDSCQTGINTNVNVTESSNNTFPSATVNSTITKTDDTAEEQEQEQEEEVPEMCVVESIFRPLDIAVQLLAAEIVNAIHRQVCVNGEGTAIRSMVHILTQFARNLNQLLMACLIEAVFRTIEEHQFRLKYEEVEIPAGVKMSAEEYYKKSRQILQITIIAILKSLLLPQMLQFILQPIRFKCMLLSNLYVALREANRIPESFRVAEHYISFYNEHKTLSSQTSKQLVKEKSNNDVNETENNVRKITNDTNAKCERHEESMETMKEQSNNVLTSDVSLTSQSESNNKNASLSSSVNAKTMIEQTQSYDIISDQEEVYKNTLFTYLRDFVLSEPLQGRKRCLAALDEFPQAAEPWILLSLVLHKEDAVNNLDDAIVAVRHAMNLEPTNLEAIMTLANFYKAGKRYALYREMMQRYWKLESLLTSDRSEEEISRIITELHSLPELMTSAHEAKEIQDVDRELNETYMQMERAMAYSVPIDKDKRTFPQKQLSSPMMQQKINSDRAEYMNDPITNE